MGAPRSRERWELRRIPPQLEKRYVDSGWWNEDTLGGLAEESLRAHPEAGVSIWSRTRPWHGRYADIDREARQLVALLQASGIEAGRVVAFQFPNCREAVVAFAALALGGYVLVPIVHIYGRKEVAFILQECGAVAYLSPASYGHVNFREIVEQAAPPSLRLHIEASDAATPSARGDVTRIPWSEVAEHDPVDERPRIDAREIVVLAYTSGTTAAPKGVIHDHRTLLSELRHMAEWQIPGKPNLMGSPVAHVTGMLGGILSPLQFGNDIHLIDRWDPQFALEVMDEAQIGGGTGASVFLAGLIDHPNFTRAHAARMRRVGLGGAPVPIALAERAAKLGVSIIRAYGSTEHPSTTGSRHEDPAELRHRTDGPPMPGVELRLLDEDGRELPAGTPGEIFSRGPELCLGYTDPALNTAFDDAGWYRTGDIGVLDAHGFLTITDRAKDIIIRGGENISAAEIEQALATLAGVAEIAVVAAPDERFGEHACAVIRLAADAQPLALADLQRHLAAAGIARQKWPEEVRIVAEYPRTASGKIRKVDLRAWLEAGAPEEKQW